MMGEIKNLKKMRLMNFRPIVVMALVMIVAIFSAVYISNTARLACFIVFISAFGIIAVLCGIFKKKALIMVSAIMLAVSISFGFVYSKSITLNSYKDYAGDEVYVYAKISEQYKYTTSGNLSLKLSDIQIRTGSGYKKLNGFITLYTNPNNLVLSDFSVGRYVFVRTSLTIFDLDAGSDDFDKSISFLSSNIVGFGYTEFYNIELTDTYNVSAREYICSKIRSKLTGINLEYSDLGYAMMVGESAYLDANIKDEFRSTGIAHLLAVSGLHFSIIFMIVSFITKLTKANYKSSFIVQMVIIFLYCYLCNFSVSVVRAGVMALVASYATIRHKAYDNLSALALVAMLTLCKNPLKLFNVSFALSFMAVASIILLTPMFERFFTKFFKDKMASTLALNISIQIGMFAINVYYFGRYAIFSGVINLILVPIATIAFALLFIGVLFSGTVPLAIYLAKGFDFLMDIVVKMNSYFTGNGIYLRLGNLSVLPVLLVLFTMIIASDYLFVKRKNKIAFVSVSAIISVLAFLL